MTLGIQIYATLPVSVIVTSIAAWFGYPNVIKNSEDSLQNYDGEDTPKSNFKCKKVVREAQPSLTQEDHISELAVELLVNILGRLSFEDVGRMSTLSKWWRNVCLSFPFVELDWGLMSGCSMCLHTKACLDYNAAYVRSVNQVLQHRKEQNILSFHLSLCLNYKQYKSDIDQWISFAAANNNKGLESLRLMFMCTDFKDNYVKCDLGDQYVVTDSWLGQFTHLKDLHLGTCILEVQSECEFRWKNIISLNLSLVTLKGDEWQTIVSGSTALKWLRLSCCNLPKKLCISKNLESLSFLMVDKCDELEELQIDASNLNTFEICVIKNIKCSFSYASKLESMYVYFRKASAATASSMFRDLINTIPSLKNLCLRTDFYQPLTLPLCKSFGSVLKLNLIKRAEDTDINGFVLTLCHTLRFFPELEMLSVMMPGVGIFPHVKYECPAPIYHSKLKEVQLYFFRELWTEFACFLLKSAVALDSMMLKSYVRCYNSRGKWIYIDYPFQVGEARRIVKALEDKAISPHAKVNVVDSRCKCYDENCMYAN